MPLCEISPKSVKLNNRTPCDLHANSYSCSWAEFISYKINAKILIILRKNNWELWLLLLKPIKLRLQSFNIFLLTSIHKYPHTLCKWGIIAQMRPQNDMICFALVFVRFDWGLFGLFLINLLVRSKRMFAQAAEKGGKVQITTILCDDKKQISLKPGQKQTQAPTERDICDSRFS